MKKALSLLSLAALTLGLLGSCSKINERIDSLEKRIDGIESTSIASVQQQIDGIKASITKLEAADVTVNGKIDELKATAETHQTLIDALKEADKTLGQKDTELEARIATLEGQVATINGQIKTLEDADKAINDRIDELKSYVDTEIGKTKDWAEETFATLEQYQQTADDLAALSVTVTGISTTLAGMQTSISGLDTKITGIDADLQGKITAAKTELEGKITSLKTELEDKIATAISASETSIKSWINELLKGYYTAAQVDAKIGSLNTAIEAAKGTAKTRIDSVATELTELKTAVDTAKAAIRTEYKNAIDVAINKLDGEIRGALLDSIAAVNGRVAALDTRVTTLEGKVLALEGNVSKLLAMIQSVSIIPAYSDGSVKAVDGILTLKCIVSPAEALIGMESLKDSLLIYADSVEVKTKAAPACMKIKVEDASILDEELGVITLTADISESLPKGEDKALTVAVNIKNGISNFTTEFVNVDNTPGYTVTFNENYGTTPATGDTTVLKGGKINKPADPTRREDYFFKNWFTKKYNSTEKEVDWNFETMTVSQDTTLYADWVKGAKVTFRKDTVNLTVCKDTVVRPGTQVNKPAVSPDSTKHVFKGWFKRKADGTFGDEWNFNTEDVSQDTTLYAKWAKVMTVAQLVATNSEFPVSSSKDAIPENVWVNADNDTCYFVTGDNLYFINGKKSKEVTKEFSYDLVRDDDGNYATEEIKFVMAADRDSVVKITLTSTNKPELNGDYAPLPGALKGVFSVSETKKVRFSQGNLTYNQTAEEPKWKFYDHQYDYLEGYDNSPVSLFPWGYDANSEHIILGSSDYVKKHTNNEGKLVDYNKGDKLVYNKASSEGGDDWGVAYCESNNITVGIWRMLSKEEWVYLINVLGDKNVIRQGKYKNNVTVCGKTGCLVLAPDDWDLTAHPLQPSYGTDSSEGNPMTWEQAEAKGLVCLPAAGYYYSGHVSGDGSDGYYWSSSADSSGSYYLYINSADLNPGRGDLQSTEWSARDQNYSVRLVTEVK